MTLRLVNKERTYPIVVCGTTLNVVSMTIGEKETLVHSIQTIGPETGAFDRLLNIIAPAITSIVGCDDMTSLQFLTAMEDFHQLQEIVRAIIKHCDLTQVERKNLPSSSEQPTPGSAGNAETLVEPDEEPVSTTQDQTV